VSKPIRDLLISLSLANLCFVSGWQVLLNPLHYSYYHWKYHPGFTEYAALVCNVLMLAALFWGAMTLAQRSGKQSVLRVARLAFLLILIVPFNNLRLQIFDPLDPNATKRLVSAVVLTLFLLLLLLAVVLKRQREKTIRGAAVVLLILFPFFFIALFQGAWLTIKYRSNAQLFRTESLAPALNSNKEGAPRVVLFVFDELDQHKAFAERPAGIELPEFDRLRGQAIFTNNAYPPGSETLTSLPSFIIGKQVSWALAVRPNELMLTLKDTNEEVGWSTQPNIFSAARANGFDTALVGWYHPYCRVIGNTLTSCFWEPVVDAINPLRGQPTMRKSMSYWLEIALFRIPGMFRVLKSRYDSERCEAHIEEHLHILEQAKMASRKREFGLTLLHFPIPHHPFIYDRSRNALSSDPDRTYEDNLVLTDRTLGEMRREMESAGLWEAATIIVTSDHWWRTPADGKIDKRIPFILKLAGQKQGMTYDAAFNTVLTSRLIQALLKGELSTPESVVHWLDQNRASVATPGI
jgi:hypothetical protein